MLKGVLPSNASNKNVDWKVEGFQGGETTIAEISSSGLLTVKEAGRIYVKAYAKDESKVYAWLHVNIIIGEEQDDLSVTEVKAENIEGEGDRLTVTLSRVMNDNLNISIDRLIDGKIDEDFKYLAKPDGDENGNITGVDGKTLTFSGITPIKATDKDQAVVYMVKNGNRDMWENSNELIIKGKKEEPEVNLDFAQGVFITTEPGIGIEVQFALNRDFDLNSEGVEDFEIHYFTEKFTQQSREITTDGTKKLVISKENLDAYRLGDGGVIPANEMIKIVVKEGFVYGVEEKVDFTNLPEALLEVLDVFKVRVELINNEGNIIKD